MSDRIVESCKANATELVLEVHRLAHTYGDVDALRGVELEVHATQRLDVAERASEPTHLEHRLACAR